MASANTTRCPISAGGDTAVMRKNASAATPTMPNRRAAEAGGFSCLTPRAARRGRAAGAADTDTAGGGQVDSPSRTTVIERWTTSSKSSTSCPSFSGVSSFIRLTRLVP